MNQELHSLAVFAVVIERGSFAAAARVLERAPSAVSTHISRLEEWFGAKLLHRTTRNLALTDAGERLLRDGAPDRWIRLPWQAERAAESTMSVDSVIAARAAVDAGLGWALLPTEDGEVETPIYAAHGFGSRLPAQVSVLIEALAEQGRRLADR